ncbi:hypothetical protein F4859DRAFT_450123 [Xylaria cf. heliscus]|nr:hypothetical protein F4859DRAFT_450123 [Xylaria cf. heliscus]
MTVTRRRASPRRSDSIATPSRRPRWLFTSHLAILLLLGSIAAVSGTPTSYFPLNSQLPPVARVSEPFSFVFSPLTFASDAEMRYALADGAPSWLSLDSTARQLSGTPDDASIPQGETLVGVVITLVASDDTGSTAANATLVVSRGAKPKVRIPLEEQIKKFGPYSAPASVLLHPSTEFDFEFDPNTFGMAPAGTRDMKAKAREVKRDGDENISGLSYYAVSGNNAPLPSWIEFDAERLAFSGKTPPFESLVQPPQKFDFQLVASDVVGFASASVDFSIAVGTHELTAEEPIIELNATRGKQLDYSDLPKILKLDKQPLVPENVSSITADGLPAWLSFDEDSWKVSGTPDAKAEPKNVTIAVVDKFSDALNVTLAVNFHTQIFTSDFPDLNVTTGDDFSFDIKKFLFAPSDTQVTTEVQPDNSWIRFDDPSKVLSGTVPKDLPAGFAGEMRVAFNAIQTHTKDKEAKYLNVHVIEDHPTPSPSPAPKNKKDDSRSYLYWLITIPVTLFIIVIAWLVFRAWGRRDRQKKLDFSEVSRPVPGSFVANGFTGASLHDIRRLMDPGSQESSIEPNGTTPASSSNLRRPQTMSNPNIEVDLVTPHAMTTQPRAETRSSWFTGRLSRPSPTGSDEVSLLSDTSIGEAVLITQEDLFPNARRLVEHAPAKKIGLAIPTIPEPFSIQPTPELAYTTPRKYDYVSDDEKKPVISYIARQRSGHQNNKSPSRSGVQHRLSKVWRKGSPSKMLGNAKRLSQRSEATDVTTRTSILASGVTQEATTASTNVIAKPTVVHIPSRPGEMRQLSRRTNDSVSFFGGGSLTKSQRNFRLTKDTIPTPVNLPREDPKLPTGGKEHNRNKDGSTAWDRQARNSLGIAYTDVIETKQATKEEPRRSVAQSENWNTHPTESFLMSPDRWPVPDVFIGLGGSADVFRSQSEPPQLPPVQTPTKAEAPVTPTHSRKKSGGVAAPRSGRRSGSISSLSQGPLTHRRSKIREERLRISRIREQRALDEFRAMVSSSSQTPSPHDNKWAAASRPRQRQRQLPETPSRTGRGAAAAAAAVLPAEGVNESRGGLKSTLSKRSVKTVRSAKSVRSVRSVRSAWADGDEDDEDAWEDIRPPESVLGEWEGAGSDGSFPVYI